MTTSSQTLRSHWPISILSSIAAVVNVLLPLFLVRLLQPAEIGTFKIFFLYLTLAPGLALTTGLINGLAFWSGKGAVGHRAVQATAMSLLLASFVSFILALCLRHEIASLFGWQDCYGLLFALAVLGTVASQFFEEAAICSGRIWTGALFYSGFEIFRTSAIVIVAVLTRSLTAVLITHTCISLLKALSGYLAGWHLGLAAFIHDKSVYYGLLRYALPVSLAGLMAIPLTYADQLILSAYIPASEFAIYAIGCLAIPPLFILEHAITRVLIPQMSSAFNEKHSSQAAYLYHQAVTDLALLLVPAVAGLIVFATPIIEILFTSSYSEASKYLVFFSFNYLLLILPYDAVPRALGQGTWILKNFLVFSILALALCLILTKQFGPFGALAGIILSKALMRGYGTFYVKRCTGWAFRDFIPVSALTRFVLISLVLSLLSLGASHYFKDPRWWFAVCAPLFAFSYFAALLIWKRKARHQASPSPRVLLLSQYLRVGGLERMVLNLASQLQNNRRWDVRVFCYDGLNIGGNAGLIPEFEKRGLSVETHQKGRGFSAAVVFKLIKKTMREDISVVHSHDLGALIYASLAKVFSPQKFKLVHTQHSFVHLQNKWRYRLYERLFPRLADQIIVVSPQNFDTYRQLGLAPSKVKIIENGVVLPPKTPCFNQKAARREALLESLRDHPLQHKLALCAESYWILCLGRIHPVKGQMRALELWKELSAETRKSAHLIFVGPGELESEATLLKNAILSAP
ncbi:MAG: glycosyltransferase, partial [Deltaproteobacteria bacterium]|nr:glycosyltransferase [Deltaproteobacteria bacterium]